MKSLLMNYRKIVVAAVVGAIAGYAYFSLVGCSGGACLISSNSYISSSYGALLGVVAVGWPETKTSIK
jgi:hypothetical protein